MDTLGRGPETRSEGLAGGQSGTTTSPTKVDLRQGELHKGDEDGPPEKRPQQPRRRVHFFFKRAVLSGSKARRAAPEAGRWTRTAVNCLSHMVFPEDLRYELLTFSNHIKSIEHTATPV